MQREAGFLDTVTKEFPGLVLLVQDQYAGATTETAYQLAENLISRFPDVEGVFAPNESSTFGMLRALQESRLAGKVVFVGFDSSPKLVQGLRDGDIQGLVLQNPVQMGYLGVKTIVAHLRGETGREGRRHRRRPGHPGQHGYRRDPGPALARPLPHRRLMSVAPAAPPVLRMAGVSKSFGATRALDDVTFELGRGEVHALIGENGAGKSTMMKILSGAIPPDAGRMEIDGRPYAPAGPGDGLRSGVSMIYQELNLAPHLTVEENIMLGREVHAAGWLDRGHDEAAGPRGPRARPPSRDLARECPSAG